MQKTLEEDSTKRETALKEFMGIYEKNEIFSLNLEY